MTLRLLALLFGLFATIFSQDTPPPPAESNQLQTAPPADPMQELPSLRSRHALGGLPPEDLFRLANLYLVEGIYPKSAELYAELIHSLEYYPAVLPSEQRTLYLARSHYNRGLALFTLGLYESAKANFQRAGYYDSSNIEALRMLGSIAFAQKDKKEASLNWTAYVDSAPEGPIKESVKNALALLNSPDFQFEPSQPEATPSWPFRNYETVPYPDALYEQKRVI